MPGSTAAEKTMLAIAPIDESNDTVITAQEFKVMLNPAGYTHTYQICYNEKKALGQSGSQPRYNNTAGETLSFKEIILDGTGVVPAANGAAARDVKTQIQQLNSVVYKYQGNDHQPNHVRLLWGSLIFFGRLKSMTAEYTLFKPSGEPLRAKLNLEFVGFLSKDAEQLTANRSSPDLTHLVEVKDGDTLPLLCHRIYKNSAYYLEIARINGITNFRNIQPGTRLNFPPLR